VRTTLGRWAALGVATAVLAVGAGAIGVPAPGLFAAILVGLVWALAAGADGMAPPRRVVLAAQAVIGATLGAYFELAPLTALGGRWLPVGAVVAATLVVSLLAGLLVAMVARLDRPTALLGLVAGGASAIVALSDELGADARLVAVMQYARVLVVVLLAPLLTAFALGERAGTGGSGGADAAAAADLVYTLAASGVGLLLARRLGAPAPALLGPLVVGAGLTATGLPSGAGVPGLVQELAFAVIGLQVGLRFTPATIRRAGRLLPVVLAAVVGMIGLCAGLAAALVALAGVRFVDAYLATTPGGIYAVLAIAVGSDADTTFVTAVQVLRMLIMVLAAPPLVRLLANRSPPLRP
jgi:membrane AbrB-like protein